MDERRPLRILVGADVPPDPNSGAAGTVWQMNRALERLGHHVDEIWADDLGRRIQHGNLHYLLELPRNYRKAVAERCQRSEYDVIELDQPHAYLAARHHRASRCPGILVNRSHGHEVRTDMELDRFQQYKCPPAKNGPRRIASGVVRKMLWKQWDLIANDADSFIVSCRHDAEFLYSHYHVAAERVGIITQGVPTRLLSTATVPMSKERLQRILYVGQLAFFKAPMILAEVVTNLLRSHPDYSMTWVCSEKDHSEVHSLFPADVLERVILKGHVPQEKLINVFDEHGMFLFPSFFEGFGKAPLEAMSRGMCVIATDVGGMRDYIVDGVNGVLAPPGNVGAITQSALDLISQPDLCQKVSLAAVATARQHTWDRCANDLVSFLRHRLKLRAQELSRIGHTSPDRARRQGLSALSFESNSPIRR